MVNCQNIQQDLIFYLEDNLSLDRNKVIDSHLELCDSCKGFAEELSLSYDIIDLEKQFDLNDEFVDSVLSKVENISRSSGNISYALKQILAYAAVVAVGIFMGILSGNILNNTGSEEYSQVNSDVIYWNDLMQEPIESFLLTE